ncbi:hypothetical protein SPBRAN_1131 [uncultured Candidatus Thioglobus sp.]|nr:hypothetical protein SPBRAN_1131 [uncultured Candidatus Thioglobus sp.]
MASIVIDGTVEEIVETPDSTSDGEGEGDDRDNDKVGKDDIYI